MADYDVTPETLIEGISGLKEETLVAIKNLIGEQSVRVISEITEDTIFTPTDHIVVTVGNDFKGDLNKAAGRVDIIDASASPTGIDVNYSGVNPDGAVAPAADNILIATLFNDRVVSNNSNQVIEGLDGDDSITTGSGEDSIAGGIGDDSLSAGAGDDSISIGSGQDSVDGGAGFDVVNVNSVALDMTFDGKILTTKGPNGDSANIKGVQVVTFGSDYNDTQFVLDNIKHGVVARLFKAVFDRKVAANGLKYWINSVDAQEGADDVLVQISNAFINSDEGKTKSLPSSSNADFVTQMYEKFVGREGVKGGIDFWNNGLDSGATTKAHVMTHFAQEAEAASFTQEFIHIVGINEIESL